MQCCAKKGGVLCVDDEPCSLRALHWVLQKDFHVQTARGGEEGLRLVKENDFDVILSDQHMPKMTGVQFLAQVKDISPRSTRLLLTGESDLLAFSAAVNAGEIWQCIEKPWNSVQLKNLVSTAAQLAQQRTDTDGAVGFGAPSPAHLRVHVDKENSL